VPPVTARRIWLPSSLAGPIAMTVPRRSSKSASHIASWAKLNVQLKIAVPAGSVSFLSTYSTRVTSALSPARAPFLPELALGGVGSTKSPNGFVVLPRSRSSA
jgi:hypothetical protein